MNTINYESYTGCTSFWEQMEFENDQINKLSCEIEMIMSNIGKQAVAAALVRAGYVKSNHPLAVIANAYEGARR